MATVQMKLVLRVTRLAQGASRTGRASKQCAGKVRYQGSIYHEDSDFLTSRPARPHCLFPSLVFCLLCVTDMKHNPFACFFCVNLTHRMGFGTSCSPSAFCRKVEKEFNKREFLFIGSLSPAHSKPQNHGGISCRA